MLELIIVIISILIMFFINNYSFNKIKEKEILNLYFALISYISIFFILIAYLLIFNKF